MNWFQRRKKWNEKFTFLYKRFLCDKIFEKYLMSTNCTLQIVHWKGAEHNNNNDCEVYDISSNDTIELF